MNDKGNATIFSLCLLFVFTVLILGSLSERLSHLKKVESTKKLLICAKIINGETKDFTSFMQKSNTALKYLSMTELVSVLLPSFGIVTKISTASAKKVVIKSQQLYLFSYLNKIKSLYSKSCLIDPRVFKTPFKLSIMKFDFQRDKWNQAKLRGNKWNLIILGSYHIIQNTYSFQDDLKIKSHYIKKVKLF